MIRLLSFFIGLVVIAGISACDKKAGVPLPRTALGEIKQVKGALDTVQVAATNEKKE